MIHFKDSNNQIFAFEQSDIDNGYVPENLTQITDTEKNEILAPTPAEQKEIDRGKAKAKRDTALQSMTHTLADGSVLQVRPQDLPNFQTALAIGTDQRWVLADNTTRLTTVTELQEALNSGVAQAQVIWSQYATDLEAL